MNKKVYRLAIAMLVLFTSLVLNLSVLQVINARDIKEQPGNRRLVLEEYSRERGPILVDDQPIAQSVPTNDELQYLREYTAPQTYAAVTGYYSVLFGATGIERMANSVLAGTDDRLLVDRLQQLFAGAQPRGGAVSLTINAAAQKAAFAGLDGRTGAVVAIEPATGRVLALVTSPSFDPNAFSSHKPSQILATQEKLQANKNKPLTNRPLTMLLPPGSTFKLITAAAALENGLGDEERMLPGPRQLDLPQTTEVMDNWNGKACSSSGEVTLRQALTVSCNTTFAWLGLELGADKLRTQARKFGFDESFDVPMRAATSRFPESPDAPQTALSAIGQFDVRASALQMAMVAAGIGNKGVVMRPYLIDQVLAPDLNVLDETRPADFGRAISEKTAATLTSMMVDVVERGTGSNARISGVKVAGKTGTAQNDSTSKPHAWFVAFAPAQDPQVAVAVVLQNGGNAAEVSGNRLAAPIARSVIQAVLKK